MKLLPGITYNLSQNIIKYNKNISSLKHHSLVLSIAKIFKESEESKKLSEKWKNKRGLSHERLNYHYSYWQITGKYLEYELRKQLKSKSVSCEKNLNTTYVQSTISFMGEQIIDFTVVKDSSSQIKLSVLVSNLVFTSQGTIHRSKSVMQAVNKTTFDEELSIFRSMCYYFFEREIKSIHALSPNGLKKLQETEEVTRHFYIYFWICEIMGTRPWISETHINNKYYKEWFDPNIEYSVVKKNIFLEAVETNNEMAVEYLWINHKNEMENSENVLKTALTKLVKDSVRTNILMFLLLQEKSENELEEIYKESSSIIQCIIKEVRWHCIFLKLFEVFKTRFWKDKDFLKIFTLLADSCCQTYPEGMNLDTVIQCFSSLDKSFKIYLIKNSISQNRNPFGRIFVKATINNENDFIEKLKLDDFTALKDFFKSECGTISIADVFKKGNISCGKKILKDIFEEDLKDFMRYFFKEKKESLRRYFILNGLVNELKSFIEFFKEFKSNIFKFKSSTPNKLDGFLIKKIIFPSEEQYECENFRQAELTLRWFIPDDKSVVIFKRDMDFLKANNFGTNFFLELIKCFLNSEFVYINELFVWKLANQDYKNNFFKKLLRTDTLINSIARKTDFEDYLRNFTTFLEWHCTIKECVNQFLQKVHDKRG